MKQFALIATGIAIAAVAAQAKPRGPRSFSQDTASCRVIDGDTIACGKKRLRLNGIDAPEMPGHCRVGRTCVAGDPIASRDNLVRLLARAPKMRVIPLKTDLYGRTVAQVWIDGLDLSCLQLDHAVYKPEWDQGRRLAVACE